MNTPKKVKFLKDSVICKTHEKSYDLYFVLEGKLLVCSQSGHMITAIKYLEKEDYFGEMSFFDKHTRSANIIAIEDCVLLQIPREFIAGKFPKWLTIMAKSMTSKIRSMDSVISKKGIKRKNLKSIQPLSIDEQRLYYKILNP